MASTAATLMTAAGRRLSRSATTSAIVLREVSGSHKLSINGCKPFKNFDQGWAWDSKPFRVGGHSWRIRYLPNGHQGHISLFLELDRGGAIDAASDVNFRFSLLDPSSGKPLPKFTRATTQPFSFHGFSSCQGFPDFIKWEDLEASGCLDDDDTFTVQCDLAFTTDLGSATEGNHLAAATPATSACAAPAAVAAPPPNGGERNHLTDLMWEQKHGADVTVDVGGGEATFDAHGWLLAWHSPVFRSELRAAAAAASNSKKSGGGGGGHRRIEIKGVEPKVFEAVLRYMYTNALPEMKVEGSGDGAMAMAAAKGLIAAADRLKMEGLKMRCEEALSRRIDVGTAAGTLAVAEQHGCRALKAACVEFLSRPEKMKAVMETEGYEKVKAIVYPIVVEIAVKQWLASSVHHGSS
ncbi:unnamed protein product [Urochloa humidicola]